MHAVIDRQKNHGMHFRVLAKALRIAHSEFLFFLPKPFFFRHAAPRARSAAHERSENKAGEIL